VLPRSMTPDAANPASAAARTGSEDIDCWAAISSTPGNIKPKIQSGASACGWGASMQRGIDARARLRHQRLVEHLHRLGPAPLGHFLHEIECGAFIPEHLEAYGRVHPDHF